MNHQSSVRTKLILSLLALTALVTSSAHAHPGHSTLDHGLVHALTSPVHLAVLASVGILLALSASLLRQPGWRLAMRCAGASAVVLAGVLWSI